MGTEGIVRPEVGRFKKPDEQEEPAVAKPKPKQSEVKSR